MPTRAEIRDMYQDMQSWRKVAHRFDLPVGTVWRYANTDYEPKRRDIREKLGLDFELEIDYVRQQRDPETGRFA